MKLNIPATEKPRVVIIGGGFGGLNLIQKLKKKKFQIVLIDRHNYHTFQPLLYQVAMGGLEPDSIAYPLRKYISSKGKDMFFRLCEVEKISPEEQLVKTDKGELDYDFLVIATGSRTNYFGIESIQKNSLELKSIPHSLDLRSLLLQNLERALMTDDKDERARLLNFVIVGGGPTGVELAGALCELKKFVFRREYHDLDIDELNIYLLEGLDRLLNGMSEKASEKTYSYLEKLGARIRLKTMVEEYDGQKIEIGEDEVIPTYNLIWTAGVEGAFPDGIDKDNIDKGNRVRVNEYCQVKDHDNLFVIGDAAAMISEENPKGHPMLAQVAIQMAKLVGANLNKSIEAKSWERFKYKNKGVLATIGRNKAVADLPSMKVQGTFAWYIWLFVHLMFLVGFQNKLVVMMNWFIGYIRYNSPLRLIIRPFKRNNNDS